MRIYDIIEKKKKGCALSSDEIKWVTGEFTSGSIPDYQMAALLMAICLKGMDDDEIYQLTKAIELSGDRVDLSAFGELTCDKHSSGGVGDKTTLIVAPLAAAMGCKIAKMSGRGLGHTGGTIDKLESIPGYRTTLDAAEFFNTVEMHGIAVVGQSGNLAPADKKIYALRDVTATVDSVGLISSSIMGKKLAAGTKNIVLDVKCGSGSFMKNENDATMLAEKMVMVGKKDGRRVCALITDMDSPLGYAIGNALEVKEAICTLKGEGPADLTELSIAISAKMVELTLGYSQKEAEQLAKDTLYSGKGFDKFKEWIAAQGGDISYIEDPEKLSPCPLCRKIKATRDGYISAFNTEKIGICALALGAGRLTKEDTIDFGAGILLCKKVSDSVSKDDTVALLYSASEKALDEGERIFNGAFEVTDTRPTPAPLIYRIVE